MPPPGSLGGGAMCCHSVFSWLWHRPLKLLELGRVAQRCRSLPHGGWQGRLNPFVSPSRLPTASECTSEWATCSPVHGDGRVSCLEQRRSSAPWPLGQRHLPHRPGAKAPTCVGVGRQGLLLRAAACSFGAMLPVVACDLRRVDQKNITYCWSLDGIRRYYWLLFGSTRYY